MIIPSILFASSAVALATGQMACASYSMLLLLAYESVLRRVSASKDC